MGLDRVIRNIGAKAFSAIADINLKLAELGGAVDVLRRGGTGYPEIDEIEGRHIFYSLHGHQDFTIAENGLKGDGITMKISQDGPFVATHYPFVMWRPTTPANATNLGLWRPVFTWPLPAQAVSGGGIVDLNEDIISISYEIADGGSDRNFQNAAIPPILSSGNDFKKLPRWTLWTPNSVVVFTPTYRQIVFNQAETPSTGGVLEVVIPGFRIVNM